MHGVLDYLERNDIAMYRMTASLAPYATHPDLPRFHRQLDESLEPLAALGERARELGVRLSTHPGQYVVLNSEDPAVRDAAVRDLELQARLLDALVLGPVAEVVLHERTGLRVVWDILHHHCNDPDGIPDREALEAALGTWPAGVTPKIHFSSPKTAMEGRKKRVGRRVERSWVLPQLRAHADVIDPIAFEHFLRETAAGHDFDVMLEAKAKDLALLRLRDQLAGRGLQTARA